MQWKFRWNKIRMTVISNYAGFVILWVMVLHLKNIGLVWLKLWFTTEIHVVFRVTFCQNLLSQTILKGTPKGTEPSIRITQVSVLWKLRLYEVLHARRPRELFVKEQFFVLSRGTTVMYFTARIFAIRVKEYHTSFFNRPLPSSKNPHFQNKVKCTFLVKMSFICTTMKNHFHIKGWALTLVLIQRLGGTRNGLFIF